MSDALMPISMLVMGAESRARAEELERKAALWDSLQGLCGHVQNASDTTVTLSQDDATRTCVVKVGTESKFHRKPRSYYGSSFEAAIQAAVDAGEIEE